jgi:hypothetical protein
LTCRVNFGNYLLSHNSEQSSASNIKKSLGSKKAIDIITKETGPLFTELKILPMILEAKNKFTVCTCLFVSLAPLLLKIPG